MLQPLIFLLLSILLIVLGTTRWRWHPLIALLLACFLYGTGSQMSLTAIVMALQEGFGKLMSSVGLLILLGCMLGQILADSGATRVLANKLIRMAGKQNPQWGITTAGILIGIPVFCDAAFVVLNKLNPDLARQSGKPAILLHLSLAIGLYLSHVFLIPTPGPLAVAGTLGLNDYGFFFGLGFFMVILGAFFSVWVISKSLAGKSAMPGLLEESKTGEISFFRALLPVSLPVLLIAIASTIRFFSSGSYWLAWGDPFPALGVGVILAVILLPRKKTKGWVSRSVQQAGPILLITAMGGAFGAVIASSELGKNLSGQLPLSGSLTGLMWGAFLLALLLKSAQGSSTSAMIITASLLSGVLSSQDYNYADLSLLALSTGAGALAVSHTNDSYFWVVSRMGNIDVGRMFKFWSLLGFLQSILIMGILSLLAIIL